jgi:hypothetical protein
LATSIATICLSREELEALSGKSERAQKRYDSQAKELDALRIPYQRRTDKTLIVYRRHVDPGYEPPAPEPKVVL